MNPLKAAGVDPARTAKRVLLTARLGDARSACVTGDFTQWSEQGIPLTRGTEGVWEAALSLCPGNYQYRLRVDGTWQDHPEAAERVPNPFGTRNCILRVR